MNLLSTENLAELIGKRHRCLVQLRDLGRRQAEMIKVGEMSPLLRLIAAKNQLIAALQSIEQGLAPYHDQDPETRNWPTAEARAQCAQQAQTCQQLLGEVMELERQNEQAMITRRDQVATQLQAAQAANTARGAYQAQQIKSPRGPHHAPLAPHSSGTSAHQLDLQSDA